MVVRAKGTTKWQPSMLYNQTRLCWEGEKFVVSQKRKVLGLVCINWEEHYIFQRPCWNEDEEKATENYLYSYNFKKCNKLRKLNLSQWESGPEEQAIPDFLCSYSPINSTLGERLEEFGRWRCMKSKKCILDMVNNKNKYVKHRNPTDHLPWLWSVWMNCTCVDLGCLTVLTPFKQTVSREEFVKEADWRSQL